MVLRRLDADKPHSDCAGIGLSAASEIGSISSFTSSFYALAGRGVVIAWIAVPPVHSDDGLAAGLLVKIRGDSGIHGTCSEGPVSTLAPVDYRIPSDFGPHNPTLEGQANLSSGSIYVSIGRYRARTCDPQRVMLVL